jgi:tetratricopeptide (TPR) repeat protein
LKTSHIKVIVIFLILSVLLGACVKDELPAPTDTPAPTSTPVPPTPTPSAGDLLVEVWQAYEDGDYQTAEDLAEKARDLAGEDDLARGEALALIGLSVLETGTIGRAVYSLEEAQEMGFQNDRVDSIIGEAYTEKIDELLAEIDLSYAPQTLVTNIELAQEYLNTLQSLVPGYPTERYTQSLYPEPFDPANYVEPNFPLAEIENLLQRLANVDRLNLNNAHIDDLIEQYPENPVVLFAQGARALREGEALDAMGFLENAVEIDPGNPDVWAYLGYTYYWLGLRLHAHDANVSSLILNPDHSLAYWNMVDLHNDYDRWETEEFEDLGFSFFHMSNDSFVMVDNPTSANGVLQIENTQEKLFIQITWRTIAADDQTQSSLEQELIDALDVNAPGWKSPYTTFNYGVVPITYRDYSYRIPGSSDYADASIAGGYCNGIMYIFDFRFTEDGYELDELHMILSAYLESFRCGLE